jgi:hypothetical protein
MSENYKPRDPDPEPDMDAYEHPDRTYDPFRAFGPLLSMVKKDSDTPAPAPESSDTEPEAPAESA